MKKHFVIALAIAALFVPTVAVAEILAPCAAVPVGTTFTKVAPASQNWNGGNITYTLTLTIPAFSGCTLNAPAIADPLPGAAQFVSASTSAAGWAVGTVPAIGASGTVNFTHTGNISGGETSTFTIVVSAPQSANGTQFSNTATFTVGNPATSIPSTANTQITPVSLQSFQVD